MLRLLELISHLPLPACDLLGRLFGNLLYWIPNRNTRTAKINIRLCFPEMPATQQRQLLRRSMRATARTFLEMPSIWRGDPQTWLDRIDPGDAQEIMRERLSQGRGLIIAAPHLGNWEVGAHLLTDTAPVTVLYRPPRQPELEQLIVEGRSSSGGTVVPTTSRGVKALFKALRKGEMVAILPDQEPKGGGREAGVFAPFFGVPAYTMVLINRLVEKTGAPVVFVYVERVSGPRPFRFHLLDAPPGLDAADPIEAATALNKGVEACVRRCPDQYQWSYRRFSTRPNDEPSLYD